MAGTMEDEQAKRSINEMFGDDDSDSDSDDQIRPVSTATTADASGLFGSDSESDEDDDEPKRTVAAPASKKRRASGATSSSKSQRRGTKNESARGNASRRQDSGDEYDSDEDVVRTKDDDDFIDQDDDLADVMDEYNQDNQKFDDERPLPEVEHHASTKEDDFFEETLRSLKTGRSRGKLRMSVQDQERLVQEVLYRMDKAHADDLVSIRDRKPALEKIKFVDQAIYMLRKQQLQPLFLDFDLLSFITKWIQPLENGSLPNLGVRTKMLNMVTHLPVMKEHLKRSGFGKVVMTLWKHPEETPDNKEVCRELIERWSRAVFDKTLDYAKLAELEAEKAESMGYHRPERRPSPKETAPTHSDVNSNPFLGHQSTEPKDTHIRALMPSELRVDFVHRPQPKIDVQTVSQQKAPPPVDSRKARLAKRMIDIGRGGRRGKHTSSMSIEGR